MSEAPRMAFAHMGIYVTDIAKMETPWYIPPVSVPLDISLSDDEIYRVTEAMVESSPGHMKRSEWHERTRRRMTEEGTIEQRILPRT